jgi:glycine cleavage system H protein
MAFKVDERARYAKTHEWVRAEGAEAVVGVSDYAQDKLSDVVFVDLPAVGKAAAKGAALLVIESVKAAEDVFSPVSGTVSAVNSALGASPELVNNDPFGDGWLVRITLSDPSEVAGLMDGDAYRKYVETL